MNIPLDCLLGVEHCSTDTTQISGELASWSWALGLAAGAVAVHEYVLRDALRTYLFLHTTKGRLVTAAMQWGLGLILFAALLPLITNRISGPAIRYIAFPAYYELIGLLVLTFAGVRFIRMSLVPERYFGYKTVRDVREVRQFFESILLSSDPRKDDIERLRALMSPATVESLSSRANAQYPTTAQQNGSSQADTGLKEIDIEVDGLLLALAHPTYVEHVARTDKQQLIAWINAADRYAAQNMRLGTIARKYTQVLLWSEGSVLDKEVSTPSAIFSTDSIAKSVFARVELLAAIDTYSTLWTEREISRLNVYLTGLEISVRSYVRHPLVQTVTARQHLCTAVTGLRLAAVLAARKLEEDGTKSRHVTPFSLLCTFAIELLWELRAEGAALNSMETKLEKGTVTRAFADLIVAMMETAGRYHAIPRMQTEVGFVARFIESPVDSQEQVSNEAFICVQQYIKQRLIDALEDWPKMSSSLLPFLLENYLGQERESQLITAKLAHEFYRTDGIAEKLLKDQAFREKNMPANWFILSSEEIVKEWHEQQLEKLAGLDRALAEKDKIDPALVGKGWIYKYDAIGSQRVYPKVEE